MPTGDRARAMSLSQLLSGLSSVEEAPECLITGLCIDSRKVREGDLFFALSTNAEQRQSHIDAAVDAGAVAIVADANIALLRPIAHAVPVAYVRDLRRQSGVIASKYYGRPADSMSVIGITGTNGKTSVCQFLAQLLDSSHMAPVGVIGTLGFGRVGALAAHTMTTPDAVELQGIFARLQDDDCRSVIMEVSSHALDQGRVADLRFDMAVLTNLTRDHLDYHGDMQAYANAKRKLFTGPSLQSAVVNLDDSFGREILDGLPDRVTTVGYGMDAQAVVGLRKPDAFVGAEDIACSATGLTMRLVGSYGVAEVGVPVLGRFNVYNVLAALAAALSRGTAFDDLIDRLGRLQGVSGRFERFGGGPRPLVVVDFAHTPDGLSQALSSLRDLSTGQLWCVFGCGGDRDRGKRALMGEVAGTYADQIIITSDNPRSEDPSLIIENIRSGIPPTVPISIVPDRAEAIRNAVLAAKSGDVVLIAGKGHETYQEVQGQRYSFSDQSVVQAVLLE